LDENLSCDVLHNFSSPFGNNFTIFPGQQQLKRDQEVLLAPVQRTQTMKVSVRQKLLVLLVAIVVIDCLLNSGLHSKHLKDLKFKSN